MLTRTVRLLLALAALASIAAPATALAQSRTIQFRSTEDPAIPNVPPGCPHANPNVRLGATVWATTTRAADGEVANEEVRAVGTASVCGRITDFTFAPGGRVPLYAEFTLEDGVYAADGDCTITSNNVPVPRLVLAGCALNVIDAPQGVKGGVATSASVFNPFRLQGFATGSFWTLHLYPDPE